MGNPLIYIGIPATGSLLHAGFKNKYWVCNAYILYTIIYNDIL